MAWKFWLPAFTATLLLSGPVCAESPVEQCDSLASSALDKSRPAGVKPVKFDDINAEAAIKACSEAVAAHPDVARYHLQYGRALNKGGRYDEALAQFTIAASAGLWLAKVNIGDMYFYGDFGTVDYAKAFAFTLEAAEHDVAYAANSVGIWYRDGIGVEKDPEKSLQWFRKAHALGDPDASLDIGWAYETGLTVPVDVVEAMRWYQIAAGNNNAMAVNNIGGFYSRGASVARDHVKAMVWYRRAQAMGNPLANINVANYVDKGVASDKNTSLAVEYVLKAFDLGDKWQDPRNAETTLNFYKWSPEFWTLMQEKLTERGYYKGPIDGRLSEETKVAFDKIVDK